MLTGSGIRGAVSGTLGVGILAGLLVGKSVGILGATAAGTRCKLSRLPDGVRLAHIAPVALIAGIGFTVSLFVADLSYRGQQLGKAQIAVLVASLAAAGLGALWIVALRRGGVARDRYDRAR